MRFRRLAREAGADSAAAWFSGDGLRRGFKGRRAQWELHNDLGPAGGGICKRNSAAKVTAADILNQVEFGFGRADPVFVAESGAVIGYFEYCKVPFHSERDVHVLRNAGGVVNQLIRDNAERRSLPKRKASVHRLQHQINSGGSFT